MNLSISPIKVQNISFGMAQFSESGYKRAQSCGDIYEPLKNKNEFYNPDFFRKKSPFQKNPFSVYVKSKLPSTKAPNSSSALDEVAQTIIDCGTTKNAYANAKFVKQLLGASKEIEKRAQGDETVQAALLEVFDRNYDNPEISTKETEELLEMVQGALDDKNYVILSGVIKNSNKN